MPPEGDKFYQGSLLRHPPQLWTGWETTREHKASPFQAQSQNKAHYGEHGADGQQVQNKFRFWS